MDWMDAHGMIDEIECAGEVLREDAMGVGDPVRPVI